MVERVMKFQTYKRYRRQSEESRKMHQRRLRLQKNLMKYENLSRDKFLSVNVPERTVQHNIITKGYVQPMHRTLFQQSSEKTVAAK